MTAIPVSTLTIFSLLLVNTAFRLYPLCLPFGKGTACLPARIPPFAHQTRAQRLGLLVGKAQKEAEKFSRVNL
jgi:hypothetical protein